jgi:hypothetical protein
MSPIPSRKRVGANQHFSVKRQLAMLNWHFAIYNALCIQPMKITTTLNRKDLVFFNFLLTPRLRSTYVTIAVVALGLTCYSVWTEGLPVTIGDWATTLIPSLAGGVGAILGGLICSLIFILLSASKLNGTLGEHQYEITREGLVEKTSANETLNRWSGIQEIGVIGPYLLFKISGYLYHMIPRRSFENRETFLAFEKEARSLWKQLA